jgi:hypothetical protein
MSKRKHFRHRLNHTCTHTHTHTQTGSYKAVRVNKDAREEKFQKLFGLCVDKDTVIIFCCVLQLVNADMRLDFWKTKVDLYHETGFLVQFNFRFPKIQSHVCVNEL